MRILFVGVFKGDGQSTNDSQLICLRQLGHQVLPYNYRKIALEYGQASRDSHLLTTIKEGAFDLVIYSKCNGVSPLVFEESSKITKTCLWFMDPLSNYDSEMRLKTSLCSYFCCDKKNVLSVALGINPRSFYVCEGFDQKVDKPHNVSKVYDISFIGSLYGNRSTLLKGVKRKVTIINDAYGEAHSLEVSKSKINLNICTEGGASDRIYKILAAQGFLMSDDWEGRSDIFEDGKDCVIFKGVEDLNSKLDYFLENRNVREEIAMNGYNKVGNLTREGWASNIIERAFD